MADPYLSKDESIILATENVTSKSVSLALVLTNKRILLIENKRTDGRLQAEEILLSKIRTTAIDESADQDLAIALSFITDTGDTKHVTLTFTQKPGEGRKHECDDWLNKIREHLLPSLDDGSLRRTEGVSPPPQKMPDQVAEPAAAGEPPGSTEEIAHGAPSVGEIFAKHERLAGLSYPAMPRISEDLSPSKSRKFIGLAILILVICAVIGGAVYYLQFMPGKPGAPPAPIVASPVITTLVTAIHTASPTPLPTLTPQETVSQTPTQSQALIPQTGIWIRVQYPGNFTGSVGAGGNIRTVTDTGERFYQMVIKTGTIRAFIQKQDGSGALLAVEMYQDGLLIKRGTTTAPRGDIDLQVDLKTTNPTPISPNATTQKP
jgi:hypothetical protein